MKKISAVFLAAVLLVSVLSGCGGKNADVYYGDKPSKTSLRICFDCWGMNSEFFSEKEAKQFFGEFASELKSNCGIEKIVFEILPQVGVERETALQRLRTEIMAGSGPDLFLVQATTKDGGYQEEAIFNYPEKSMEVGLFLPLDEYMENHTRFTDWDAQTQAVLNVGRTDEGQVLIPMTYDIPILLYRKDEVHIPYTKDLTRREILDDPENANLGAVLYSAVGKSYLSEFGSTMYDSYPDAISDILGKYADYEKEELLFTEEELYAITNEAFKLRGVMETNDWPFFEWASRIPSTFVYMLNVDQNMTLVPRYTKDGGVTARVTAFMAVNRSTKFPEEAFSVIDYLMQEKIQRYGPIYDSYFNCGFPLQNDLGSAEKPFDAGSEEYVRSLSEPHMEAFLSIKEQITDVNIESNVDLILRDMYTEIVLGGIYDADFSADVPREPVAKAYEQMKRAMKE